MGGGACRDQRLRRRRAAAVLLPGTQGRRIHRLRLLDLLRRLRRRSQPGRPPQARRRAGLGGCPVGLGLASEPAHPLQPRLRRPGRQAVERAQGAGLVGPAGGMSRWLPYLSELQPEFFCEVSPELAAERGLEHLGWATIVTARAAVEARVLVTDRMIPLTVDGRRLHQVGLPYHWGSSGLSTGDSANDLVGLSLDPNVHIQE